MRFGENIGNPEKLKGISNILGFSNDLNIFNFRNIFNIFNLVFNILDILHTLKIFNAS